MDDARTVEPPALVCLAEVAWGYFRTRKRFLLARLAARGWRVIYCEPPAVGRGTGPGARHEDGVTVVTIPFLKPSTSVPFYNAVIAAPLGRRLVEWIAARALGRWLGRLRVARPVLVVSNVYAASVVPGLGARLVCYDFNDHPLQHQDVPGWAEDYFARLLAESDLVLAVSESYRRELAARTTAPVITLENGVEYLRFARPVGDPPPGLAALPRPRFGYLGQLSHFLDVALLERLAERFPHPLVLAGPWPAGMRRALAPLLARPNVHYLGELAYETVPAALAGLDVALIPFRAGERFTTGINPNKLYQYLAAGVPVVSSPIADVHDDPAGLYFAASHEDFERAVRYALSAPREPERLRALARDHDWDGLAARMDALLREHLARVAATR